MTRLTSTPAVHASNAAISNRRGVARRMVAAVVLCGATLAAALAPSGLVSAERAATSSPSIAKRAQGALDALARWNMAESPSDYVRFVRARDAVAELIAADLALDPDAVRTELAAPALANQHAALAALSQLGVSYRSMASEPGVAFDCSGLTSFAYATAGVSVPRSSGDQLRAATRVDREQAEVGDLVHYPGHVGMYLGGNIYVHSPEPGRDVEVIVMPDRSLSFGDLTP